MKLNAYLKGRDLRPAHFAREIGVAPSTVTRLLRGERRPSAALAALIEATTGGEVRLRDMVELASVPAETRDLGASPAGSGDDLPSPELAGLHPEVSS